jgi:hypothetical protein
MGPIEAAKSEMSADGARVVNLCSALSECRRRPVARLDGGGHAAALGAERQGTLLCRCRRGVAARACGGEGRDLEQRHADETLRAALLCRRQLWPHVRRVARRPTVRDDQSARDRGERRAARAHRRATLGRGAEAPRADEIASRNRRSLPFEDRGRRERFPRCSKRKASRRSQGTRDFRAPGGSSFIATGLESFSTHVAADGRLIWNGWADNRVDSERR